MFEQHERWLEELLEYTNRKEAVTCRSGYVRSSQATHMVVGDSSWRTMVEHLVS